MQRLSARDSGTSDTGVVAPQSEQARLYAGQCGGGRHPQSQALGNHIQSALENGQRSDIDFSAFSPALLGALDPALLQRIGAKATMVTLSPGCAQSTVESFAQLEKLKYLKATGVVMDPGGTLDLTAAPRLNKLVVDSGIPVASRPGVTIQRLPPPEPAFALPVPQPLPTQPQAAAAAATPSTQAVLAALAAAVPPISPAERGRAVRHLNAVLQTLQTVYENPDTLHGLDAQALPALQTLRSALSNRPGLQGLNTPVPTSVPWDLLPGLQQCFEDARDGAGQQLFPGTATTQAAPHGTFHIGLHCANMQEYHDGELRRVIIAVPGFTGTGVTGRSAAVRAAKDLSTTLRQGTSLLMSALGAHTLMHDIGLVLSYYLAAQAAERPDLDITVVFHSYSCAAGALTVQDQVINGMCPRALLVNPAPLPVLPRALKAHYDEGLARIGGLPALVTSVHSFVAPDDPVQKIQEGRVVSKLLDLTHRNLSPHDISAVHTYHDPGLSGVEQHDHPSRSIRHGIQRETPAGRDPTHLIDLLALSLRDRP